MFKLAVRKAIIRQANLIGLEVEAWVIGLIKPLLFIYF
jgi:hypothetical protein